MNGHRSRCTTNKLFDFLKQLDRKVTACINSRKQERCIGKLDVQRDTEDDSEKSRGRRRANIKDRLLSWYPTQHSVKIKQEQNKKA